ncbi:MAG: asparagine synthase (glutamine-hydrolyzing) [Fimbriimonadaceae bacterium]
MCGICGAVSFSNPVDTDRVIAMREAMAPRGPDAAGLWGPESGRVVLGHRRLAILGLSPLGNQPMHSKCGRYTLVFNGEIYNFRDLAARLPDGGASLESGSDTEVLLELLAREGRAVLFRLRGMYAFGLWDSSTRRLTLARDPLGIKPLYYWGGPADFRFASQVKALLASGIDPGPADPVGHAGFFLFGHQPVGHTLWQGIRELPPGTWLEVSEDGIDGPHAFESVDQILFATPAELDARTLEHALRESVAAHLLADVPVTVFLSAGKDSTTVLALASEVSSGPVRAATLQFSGYRDTPNDETPIAREVAAAYGAEHTVAAIERADFADELSRMLHAMDRPTIDGVNTYMVCKVAAQNGVKVALSGLGADEIFGGYPSFAQIPRLIRSARGLGGVGSLVRKALQGVPLPDRVSPKTLGLLEYGGTPEGAFFLRRALHMPWELPDLIGDDMAREALARFDPVEHLRELTAAAPNLHAKIALLEMRGYMMPRLLVDSDWASMAHSIELRVPFVDRDLFRTVGPMIAGPRPPDKASMLAAPKRRPPASVWSRPKTGFQVPVNQWLAQMSGIPRPPRSLRHWSRFVYQAFVDGPSFDPERAAAGLAGSLPSQ